ncbi:MAG TPA: 5-methyltetrahydropteroyltriglutamate--homocysteine S-methyltransferase [Candidatus Tectomicrobia bacterium]|jgi:5-methyltetrahydropteroyltriglutamate--homocysteine methyltransferase
MLRLPSRADHVGSLLRPAALQKARAQHASGTLSTEALRHIEDGCIREVIRMQEELGLHTVTDGEYRRAFWHYDFLAGLDGVELVEVSSGIQFSGGLQVRPVAPAVASRLDYTTDHMVDHFRFVQANTRVTPKQSIPSPTALHYRGGRQAISAAVYPELDSFFHDLGLAYQKAIAAFARAGCTYLQLDEVYLAYLCDPRQHEALRARGENPDRLVQTYAQLINLAIAQRPADMLLAMHLCRGNFRSSWIAQGGYEPVADLLFNGIGIDVYFMEYDTERAGGFEPLRFLPPNKVVVLGLVTSKTGTLEDKDALKRRIDQAARYVSPDQLALSPQCGFASTEEGNMLTDEQQRAKLALVVEVAQEVWGGL